MTVDRRLLTDLTLQALDDLGGRAVAHDVADYVRGLLARDEYDAICDAMFVEKIRRTLRHPGPDGMPHAASIRGTYVKRALWTVDDYRWVIADHWARSRTEGRRAYAEARQCRRRFGVWIEPASTIREGLAG